MTAPAHTRMVARTPSDLVAIVPLVLGFHPSDSVVLLTFGPPGGSFHARVDLPVSRDEQVHVAEMLLGAVVANDVRRAAVLLFTDDVAAAEAQADEILGRLLEHSCSVIEVIRVDDGHWHPVPDDGGPGTAYDLQTHPFTAQHVFDGQVVHADREALVDSLVGTDEDDATAVALAATRFADHLFSRQAAAPGSVAAMRDEATWLQRRVRRYLEDRSRPTAGEAGRMLVLASLVPTRDAAWAEITRPSAPEHVELWRDLVRRAPRDLLPGAGSLLAFAAWQRGDGALAWCSLDRVLDADPDYSMAHLVAGILTRAVPPDVWDPMDPGSLPVFDDDGPVAGQAGDRAS